MPRIYIGFTAQCLSYPVLAPPYSLPPPSPPPRKCSSRQSYLEYRPSPPVLPPTTCATNQSHFRQKSFRGIPGPKMMEKSTLKWSSKRAINCRKVAKTKAFRRVGSKTLLAGKSRKRGLKNPYKQAIKNPKHGPI
jgi:hypothetical protein